MNGHYPETFKDVVADPLDRPGKAEERQALSESVFGHRGRRLRHVRKSTLMNLGGPVPVHRRWTGARRKPSDASTGNSDHAILAMKRVTTVERRDVAEKRKWPMRKSEPNSESGNSPGPSAGEEHDPQFPGEPQ